MHGSSRQRVAIMEMGAEIQRRLHTMNNPNEIPRDSQRGTDGGVAPLVLCDLRYHRLHLPFSLRADRAGIKQLLVLCSQRWRQLDCCHTTSSFWVIMFD